MILHHTAYKGGVLQLQASINRLNTYVTDKEAVPAPLSSNHVILKGPIRAGGNACRRRKRRETQSPYPLVIRRRLELSLLTINSVVRAHDASRMSLMKINTRKQLLCPLLHCQIELTRCTHERKAGQ